MPDVEARHFNGSGEGAIEPGQATEKRRFSRAVGAHDADELPARCIEGNLPQRLILAIGKIQIADPNRLAAPGFAQLLRLRPNRHRPRLPQHFQVLFVKRNRCAIEHDCAVLHDDQPVGLSQQPVEPVLDDDDRHFSQGSQLLDGRPHLQRGVRTQTRSRFVQDENFRFHG